MWYASIKKINITSDINKFIMANELSFHDYILMRDLVAVNNSVSTNH